MIITALSDWHGNFELLPVPPSDVICVAGDMIERKKDIPKLERWLADLPAPHVLFVPGNHDWTLGEEWRPKGYPKVKNLGRYTVSCKGIIFGGFSWSYCTEESGMADVYGFCSTDQNDIITRVSQIPRCHVLVSHSPPQGILDGPNHIGLPRLAHTLMQHNVFAMFCGHAHEDGGRVSHVEGCEIYNVATTMRTIQF
jgi:Icc-related predicted phosphoesterase